MGLELLIFYYESKFKIKTEILLIFFVGAGGAEGGKGELE